MNLKARAAAAETAAGRLRGRATEYGVVWTDASLRQAWAAGMATDCHVEESHEDGTEVWRVEVRPRREDGDLGRVFDASGADVGRLVRCEGGTFTVEPD